MDEIDLGRHLSFQLLLWLDYSSSVYEIADLFDLGFVHVSYFLKLSSFFG